MKKTIAVLAGDGIGPEIMEEALKVLNKVVEVFKHDFTFVNGLIGGAAYDVYKNHFPKETIEICEKSDAILFGSVGGPVEKQMEEKWKDCETNSILAIRKYFKFNVNMRPVKIYKDLIDGCVLRRDIVEKGIDILCMRELSSDVYFGKHEIFEKDGARVAFDEMIYKESEIEAIAHAAFKAAMKRKTKVSSVDKANVLACSKLWREVVSEVHKKYPKCQLEHVLVDNMSMQLMKRPYEFDVILMPNMFGDILSDEASVLAGSLGMLPSASLNAEGFGLYEPSSGSAPKLTGLGVANPIGQILSAAMMLKYSFSMDTEHEAIVEAVDKVLSDGYRTKDIAAPEHTYVSTDAIGDAISAAIRNN